MTITEKLDDIAENFIDLTDDKELLEAVIEYGEDVEGKREDFTQQDRVPGCASDAYVQAHIKNNKITLTGWSASLIIKGYFAIIKEAFDEEAVEEVLTSKQTLEAFIKKTGLDVSLIPSRTNSLERLFSFILEKIKEKK